MINELSQMLFFNFCLFYFFKFQMTIVKNLIKKPSFFTTDFEGSYKILLHHKYFWSTYFWQWNDGPFNNFWNFHGNAFSFFITTWFQYYNLTFDDTFKTYCCGNLNSNFINKLYLRAVEYTDSFFLLFFLFCFFSIFKTFVKNFMRIQSFFNRNF